MMGLPDGPKGFKLGLAVSTQYWRVIDTGMGSRQFCRCRSEARQQCPQPRQGRGRELEAEAMQTKFEARPRRGDPPPEKTLLPLDVGL